MSQSLAKIYVHLIFSTKERFPFIIAEWRSKLHAFMAGIIKKQTDCSFQVIGGTADHVHILFCLPKDHALSEIIRSLKAHSSIWMKQQGCNKFAWQGGYAAFSISESIIETTNNYIEKQEEHHRTMSFAEEISRFCKLYKIEKYDKGYFMQD